MIEIGLFVNYLNCYVGLRDNFSFVDKCQNIKYFELPQNINNFIDDRSKKAVVDEETKKWFNNEKSDTVILVCLNKYFVKYDYFVYYKRSNSQYFDRIGLKFKASKARPTSKPIEGIISYWIRGNGVQETEQMRMYLMKMENYYKDGMCLVHVIYLAFH